MTTRDESTGLPSPVPSGAADDSRSIFESAQARLRPPVTLGREVAPSVARRVESILTAADAAAADFRREVEHHAIAQAEELRENAQAEAIAIRREALADATDYANEARRRVDQFAGDRIARMSALTDELISQADQLQHDFAAAAIVRGQLHELISAIGNVAAHVASIAEESGPRIAPAPWVLDAGGEVTGS